MIKLRLIWETEANPWFCEYVECKSVLDIDNCVSDYKKIGKAKGWTFDGWEEIKSSESKEMENVLTEGFGW